MTVDRTTTEGTAAGRTRCPKCDRELSTRGLPGHIRAVHGRGLLRSWTDIR